MTSEPRTKLLDAAVDYVVEHGLAGLSLRELAAAIGTSHRMLIYHFGSKEGLVVAVVQAVEAEQRAQLAKLRTDPDVPADRAMRLMWRRFTDPAMWPHERLFFEVYSQALQGRTGTTGLLDNIVDSWVEPIADYAVSRGVPRATALADARLAVAVCRGLLLDLLATGDRKSVDAAFDRYLALSAFSGPFGPHSAPNGPQSAKRRAGAGTLRRR